MENNIYISSLIDYLNNEENENKRKSLKYYQMCGHYWINKYLRDGISDDEFISKNDILTINKLSEIKEHIKNIDNIFLKNNISCDNEFVVYRGVKKPRFIDNVIYSGFDKGFLSTSTSIKTAEKYAGGRGVIYQYTVKKNIPYIHVNVITDCESEILLPRGLTYILKETKKIKRNIYCIMEIVENCF